jgi:hypothetical protein
MRGLILVYCGGAALGAAVSVVACAESPNETDSEVSPDSGQSEVVIDGSFEVDGGTDTGTGASECSLGGWCRTTLPDEDLVLRDVWPVKGYAFAIAESSTRGVKILHWSDAEGAWTYIDDGTQNSVGFGDYAGRVWAPNEDEIYYGVAPGYIYHGMRPVPPATAWVWTRQKLEDKSHPDFVDPMDGYPESTRIGVRYPALGVWGTSANDVYAWFSNAIYHLTKVDGGAPEWVLEYTASDTTAATERMFFFAAAGEGPDGVWFSGARARPGVGCALVMHKRNGVYRRVADGNLAHGLATCGVRAGDVNLSGVTGWLTDIRATSGTQIVGLLDARTVVKISAVGDDYSRTTASRQAEPWNNVNSMWVAPDGFWLSSFGTIFRGTNDIWDGGSYAFSSVAFDGTPFNRAIYQIRGTSSSDLWAVGAFHAFHKTTP